MTSLSLIQEFLAQPRLAIAGVSRQPGEISRALLREFHSQGYQVIPVNPTGGELDGQPCFARLQDIYPPVDTVLLMTPPAATEDLIHDCAQAGVRRVWMYRAGGQGAVSARAVEFCGRQGISVIDGGCPFMFLPNPAWIHRAHGWLMKLCGAYPA